MRLRKLGLQGRVYATSRALACDMNIHLHTYMYIHESMCVYIYIDTDMNIRRDVRPIGAINNNVGFSLKAA